MRVALRAGYYMLRISAVFTILGIFRFCRITLFVDVTSEGSLRNAPCRKPFIVVYRTLHGGEKRTNVRDRPIVYYSRSAARYTPSYNNYCYCYCINRSRVCSECKRRYRIFVCRVCRL